MKTIDYRTDYLKIVFIGNSTGKFDWEKLKRSDVKDFVHSPKNHRISKMVVWRSQTPFFLHIQKTLPFRRVWVFLLPSPKLT